MALQSSGRKPAAFWPGLASVALVGLALFALFVSAPGARAQTNGYLQVTAGLSHSCAIQRIHDSGAGPVQCWGDNYYGQTSAPGGVKFTQITAGDVHTCGLKPDGSVQCWGSNEKLDSCVPETGICYYDWTGQATPRAEFKYKQISAGAYYTCGVTAEDSIVCWGLNSKGEAGDKIGSYAEVATGKDHTCALRKADGGVECWGNDAYFKTSAPDGVSFKRITAGENHTCGIDVNENVACWGGNTWGQAPDYRPGPDTQISAGNLFTCAIRSNGALDCWGYNFYGQVGKAPQGAFAQVDGGGGHACAVASDGQIACWGRNDHGQANVPNVGGPFQPPLYPFKGFYPPVAAAPTLNVVNAGSTAPLKFGLGGDQGLAVIEADYPASGPLDCATLDPGDGLQPAKTAGKSGLTYDAAIDQYTYPWKTEKAWAGTCRYLSLRLTDGAEHRVAFQFR